MKTILFSILALALLLVSCSDSDGLPVAPGGAYSDPIVTFNASSDCHKTPFALVLFVDDIAIGNYSPFPINGVDVHVPAGKHTFFTKTPSGRIVQKGTFTSPWGLRWVGLACPHPL